MIAAIGELKATDKNSGTVFSFSDWFGNIFKTETQIKNGELLKSIVSRINTTGEKDTVAHEAILSITDKDREEVQKLYEGILRDSRTDVAFDEKKIWILIQNWILQKINDAQFEKIFSLLTNTSFQKADLQKLKSVYVYNKNKDIKRGTLIYKYAEIEYKHQADLKKNPNAIVEKLKTQEKIFLEIINRQTGGKPADEALYKIRARHLQNILSQWEEKNRAFIINFSNS